MTEKGHDGKKLVFTKPISEKLPFQNASLDILDILFITFFFRKSRTKLQNLKEATCILTTELPGAEEMKISSGD